MQLSLLDLQQRLLPLGCLSVVAELAVMACDMYVHFAAAEGACGALTRAVGCSECMTA